MRPPGVDILLLGLFALPSVSAHPATWQCCSALSQRPELRSKVYTATNPKYGERLKTYYSANAAQSPWCMVMPETTKDVSAVAQTLSALDCPFGMRSGAHSAWQGANGVKDGVTIDFGYMNTTTYDTKNKIAKIQPGSDWGRVYESLNPYNVTTVGGRASVVGVGGFTTGGGYSFHSNSRGFACDNVANFEIVLADGRIVNANKDQNTDLWKALKGASGNFGFVTRVDQHIVESNKLWGGFLVFDLAERDKVYNAYAKFADNMEKDPASQIIASVQYDGTKRILLAVLSNTDAVPMAPAFNDFKTIKNVSNTLSTGDLATLVPQFTGPTPLGLYANWMTGLTTNDVRILQFIDQKHAEYVEKMKAAAPSSNFSVLVQFQPVTESMVKHSAPRGGNVLGLEKLVKDGPTQMWLIAVTVDTAENQKKINPLTIEYRNAVDAYATKIGANKNWQYLNYALGDQDPIGHYGSDVAKFLKATARKYDPKGSFQKMRRSGFKLPA